MSERWAKASASYVFGGLLIALVAPVVPAFADTPATAVPLEEVRQRSWLQYRGNSSKSGFARWPLPQGPAGQVIWRLELGQMTEASPVVDLQGKVYVAGVKDQQGAERLVSVHPNGTLEWSIVLAQGARGLMTPAIRRDGQLVVTGYGPPFWYVFLVRPWRSPTKAATLEGGAFSSPTLDPDDNVYVWHNAKKGNTDYGFSLVKFDRNFAGKRVGGIEQGFVGVGPGLSDFYKVFVDCFPGCPFNPPLIGPTLPTLIPSPPLGSCDDLVGSAWETVRARSSGGEVWQKKIFGITTPAMGAGGRAYIATYNKDDQQGAVEGRDQDGAKRWEMKLPRPHAALAPPAVGVGVRAPGDTSSVRCNANPRDHRHFSQADDVYLPTSDGLYALDYKGRTRWVERDVGRTFVGAPVVVQLQNGEQIIIVADTGASSSLLHAFAHDGRRLWQVALDSPSRGSPAVAHGRIYVATERSLYAVGFVAPRLPVGVTTLPRR